MLWFLSHSFIQPTGLSDIPVLRKESRFMRTAFPPASSCDCWGPELSKGAHGWAVSRCDVWLEDRFWWQVHAAHLCYLTALCYWPTGQLQPHGNGVWGPRQHWVFGFLGFFLCCDFGFHLTSGYLGITIPTDMVRNKGCIQVLYQIMNFNLGTANGEGFFFLSYRIAPFKILRIWTNIISSEIFITLAQTIKDVCSPIGDFFFTWILMDFRGKSLNNEVLKYSKLLFYWEINGTLEAWINHYS